MKYVIINQIGQEIEVETDKKGIDALKFSGWIIKGARQC